MKYFISRSLFNTFIAFCVFFASVFTPYYGVKKAFAVLPVLGYAVSLVMANKTTALTVAGLTALVGATIYGLTSQVKDDQGNVYAEDIITTSTSPEAMEAMYKYAKPTAPSTVTVADDGNLGKTRGYIVIGTSTVNTIGKTTDESFDFATENVVSYGKDPKDACQYYANKLNERFNDDLLRDGSLLDEVIKRSDAVKFICETCDLVDPRDRDSIQKYNDDIDLRKAIGGFYDCQVKGKRNDEDSWRYKANVAIKLSNEVLKCADGYVPSEKEGEENTCILNDATEVTTDNKVNTKFDESDKSKGYKTNDKDKLAGKTSTSFDDDGGVTLAVGGNSNNGGSAGSSSSVTTGGYKQIPASTSDGKSISGYELEKPQQVVNVMPEFEEVCPDGYHCYTKKTGDIMSVYQMNGDNEILVGTVYIDENGVVQNVELDSMEGYLTYEKGRKGNELVIYNSDDELEDWIFTPNGSNIYSPSPVTNYNFSINSNETNTVNWNVDGGNTETGDGGSTSGGSQTGDGGSTSGESSTDSGGNTDTGGSESGQQSGENPSSGEQGNQGNQENQQGSNDEVTFPNDYALRSDVHETTSAVNKLNATAENINENLSKLTEEIEPPEPPDVNMDGTMGDYGKEFTDLLSWKLPPHRSECPSPEFEIFGKIYNFDAACYLWEQNRDLIGTIMNLFWVISGLFIVLRS